MVGLCIVMSCDGDNGNGPDYPDALEGAWIMLIGEAVPGESAKYIIFDGHGLITDLGAYNTPDSAGSYSVESDGHFSGYLWDEDDYIPIFGQTHSDSTAELKGVRAPGDDTLSISLIKVMHQSLCQGNWSGSFVDDSTQFTFSVQMVINEYGRIQSCSGFAGPVYGKFFFQAGHLVGHFYTGQQTRWNQIGIEGGSLTGDTMAGNFGVDDSSWTGGSFSLER
jgi:hypothetical protein